METISSNQVKGGVKNSLARVLENSEFNEKHGLFSELIVMQPTSFCNLDCSYCYLPDRSNRGKMPIEVAERIALDIEDFSTIVWHSGEPLSTGIAHFKSLLEPFDSSNIRHSVQTNATLINDEWCDLFKKYRFNIGVSVDGPEELNEMRVSRKGIPIFDQIVKGIDILNRNDVPFSIISVVREDTSDRAEDIYNFAIKSGATKLSINMEEVEGINSRSGFQDYDLAVHFWKDLYNAWKENPTIRIREFEKVNSRLYRISKEGGFPKRHSFENPQRETELIPTITTTGDVTLFSPELISFGQEYVVGNVLEVPLREIIRSGLESDFVSDYSVALSSCKEDCEIYGICMGALPSNRLSEHGRIDVRETNYCRVKEQALVEAVLGKYE